jgi:hypothetical protein
MTYEIGLEVEIKFTYHVWFYGRGLEIEKKEKKLSLFSKKWEVRVESGERDFGGGEIFLAGIKVCGHWNKKRKISSTFNQVYRYLYNFQNFFVLNLYWFWFK